LRWNRRAGPGSNDNTVPVQMAHVNERTDKWAEDEDAKLRDAVETHGDKSWAAIATLVPGRGEGSLITDGGMP
jgi:hypothetical protein